MSKRASRRAGHGVVALAVMATLLTYRSRPADAFSGYLPNPGTLWVKLAYSRWQPDERFVGSFVDEEGLSAGEVARVDPTARQSEFDYLAVSLDLQVVPLERLAFGLYVPLFERAESRMDGTRSRLAGVGDLFVYAGYQVTPRGLDIGSSFFIHGKIPLAGAAFDDLPVSVADGQVDIGVENITSWSISRQLELSGRIGYRVRFPRPAGGDAARLAPGDETELGLELGGAPIEWLWLRATYGALLGRGTSNEVRPAEPATANGESVGAEVRERELHYLEAGAYAQFGHWLHDDLAPLSCEVWFRQPVAGRDALRGPAFGVGLSFATNWLD